MARALAACGADRAVRVVLPEAWADVAGAVLMDLLGPFELQSAPLLGDGADRMAALVFYPVADHLPDGGTAPEFDEILAALSPAVGLSGHVRLETYDVSRDWVEGWRDHFRPVLIGEVRIRPPWEPVLGATGASGQAPPDTGTTADPPGSQTAALIDVVINPGLGFGTGLHPTTRGVLRLLQDGAGSPRGGLVDVGTGSGVLAIAAAKLGWRPILAFDNDPVALQSAWENVLANGVEGTVEIAEAAVADTPPARFAAATVLANMTLEPVVALVRRLATRIPATADNAPATGATPLPIRPRRLVVSGILAGEQERELLAIARECGFTPGLRICEAEWVSLELLPTASPED